MDGFAHCGSMNSTTVTERTAEVRIAHRHNGPQGFGHGGVTAGCLAATIDHAAARAARVRFHQMIPFRVPLVMHEREGDARHFAAGNTRIATVRPLRERLDVSPFDRLPAQSVLAAEQESFATPGNGHPHPGCFACGNSRPAGDGMDLRPGPVREGLFATNWTPQGTGPVPAWMVWAALDCPTGAPAVAAAPAGHAVLTGELAVEIRDEIPADQQYQLQSRIVRVEGRKVFTEAAMVDGDGRNRAVAQAIWICVPTSDTAPAERKAGA